jgi:hypothetical protein
MDQSESAAFTDLPSGEVQLRGSLERVRVAFSGPNYPQTISTTLEVMPRLLEQLNLLYGIIQADLSQLENNKENVLKRTALEELRANTNRSLQAGTNVLAMVSLADEIRKTRESESRLQTFPELLEERNMAEPWEVNLIAELEATTDALHKINQALSLGQTHLRKPDPGGGAAASSQPQFDSRQYWSPRF